MIELLWYVGKFFKELESFFFKKKGENNISIIDTRNKCVRTKVWERNNRVWAENKGSQTCLRNDQKFGPSSTLPYILP